MSSTLVQILPPATITIQPEVACFGRPLRILVGPQIAARFPFSSFGVRPGSVSERCLGRSSGQCRARAASRLL